MKNLLEPKIINLASKFTQPIYVVGGFVRNFLICGKKSKDVDLASNIPVQDLKAVLEDMGATDFTEFTLTGTLIFKLNGKKYEYTRFRKESYTLGEHRPTSVEFVDDICLDAIRRDFKCNAIYYDIKNDKIVDPLDGRKDVENKVLDTVIQPDMVLASDGIRLLRLARFCGELGFTPTEQVLENAKKYIFNLKDISGDRILSELKAIFIADKKHTFSPKDGHILAVNTLKDINAFEQIFNNCKPTNFELFSSASVEQREYAFYIDLIECSLDKQLKNVNEKPKRIQEIVTIYNATKQASGLKRAQIKGFLIKYYAVWDKAKGLINSKRIEKVYQKLAKKGLPFNISKLNITANDLIELGYSNKQIGAVFNLLWQDCIKKPSKNNKQKLLKIAKKIIKIR